MHLRRLGVRTRLRGLARRLGEVPHWLRLRRLANDQPSDYRSYLDIQLRRTLSKRETDPGIGAVMLINAVAAAKPAARSVLCVGARNALELDRFREHGFEDVIGIDLFSQRDDIKVMDMHAMSFGDGTFDIVYCSHALEHAYDVDRAAGEFVRVARDGGVIGLEVPVRTQRSAADRIVFSGLDDVRRVFAGAIGEEVLGEEQPARSATNDQGTEIARLAFTVRKDRSA